MNRLILLTCIAVASQAIAGMPTVARGATNSNNNAAGIAEGAPSALTHWSKLIGRWRTIEEGLTPDGKSWQPSDSASWEFMWAFGGWGIQDNYVSPPLTERLVDERARQRGTNIRIYDVNENQWVITWLTTASSKPASFTAESTDTTIVMRAKELTPSGYHSRITFFDMTDKSFRWKLEYSKDQESWFEVYRISGERESTPQ